MDITRWSTPKSDWLYSLQPKIEKLYTWQPTPVLLPGKSHGQRRLVGYSLWGCKESDMTERLHSYIQSAKTWLGVGCGSDHELLIAKFRLKLKKVGKHSRPFRYDLNQITYDYTVKVRNRFKGLDLIVRVPDELWTEVHDIVQETGSKTIPKKKKWKKKKKKTTIQLSSFHTLGRQCSKSLKLGFSSTWTENCGELPVRTGSFVWRTQLWELPQSLRVCLQT